MSKVRLLLLASFLSFPLSVLAQDAAVVVDDNDAPAPAAVVEETTAPAVMVETTTDTGVIMVDPVIVTTVPAVKETIAIPTGSDFCFMVKAMYFNNNWIPEHKVCHFVDNKLGTLWVDSYWACKTYTPDGVCSDWAWTPGHWNKDCTVF